MQVKVIRQPYLIDRLVVNDVSGSSAAAGLACVYLSEFGVAAAAFTLHSPENKIIKVRSDPARGAPLGQKGFARLTTWQTHIMDRRRYSF